MKCIEVPYTLLIKGLEIIFMKENESIRKMRSIIYVTVISQFFKNRKIHIFN